MALSTLGVVLPCQQSHKLVCPASSGLCYVRSLVPSTLVCAMSSQIALWLFLGDGLMSPSMFVCHQSQGRSGLS